MENQTEEKLERQKEARWQVNKELMERHWYGKGSELNKTTAVVGLKVLPENYDKYKEERENEDEKQRLKSYLCETRQKFQSLGCGFHRNVFYFGTKLYRDGKMYTAVVTSDKRVYVNAGMQDEIREKYGLNYKDDFFDEGIDNIFCNTAINKWVFEDTEDISIKTLHKKLIEILKKYLYFEDERVYSLLACYRIAGFFMPIWKTRARLFILAEMGSAKSRLTQILHRLGFNSIALGDWTLPYLQRLIESTGGETHIDDFETLDEEKKKATIRLYKVGFMRGFKAGKISDGKIRKPETFNLFNSTTLNNTEGLDFISLDRSITIRLPKISKKEYDIEPNFDEPVWQELSNELYIAGLKYADEVKDNYDKITSEKINGRLLSIIKPELTIARMISEEVYNNIENLWIDEIEQREPIDFETDWGFLCLKRIYELNTDDFFNLTGDVVEPVGKELYDELEFKSKKRSMATTIGNTLKRNPIFKKRTVNGKTQYKVARKSFISLLEAKRFLKPIKEIIGEKDAALPSYIKTPTPTTSPPSPTLPSPLTPTTSTGSTIKEEYDNEKPIVEIIKIKSLKGGNNIKWF